jgi:hypothetical protein
MLRLFQYVGTSTAGLGLKRKNAEKEAKDPKLKKAKTLAEKREFLQDDIMRYGVAAIEKMYPRQAFHQKPLVPKSPLKGVRGSPIKMKPRAIGLDFEEIDARKILKPFSHAKYIKEPDYDSVVYINRRAGLVPLASLCNEDTKTVLSSDVKLLRGRNVRLGKPRLFVKENGRLVAVGGSRDPTANGIQVIKAPKLVKILPLEKMVSFQIDSEFADFAASALKIPAKMKRIDIRVIKRQKRLEALETKDLKTVLEEEKSSITNHLMDKFDVSLPAPQEEEEIIKKTEAEDNKVKEEGQTVILYNNEKNENFDETAKTITNEDQAGEDFADEEDESRAELGLGMSDKVELHNEWSDDKTKGSIPIDIADDRPVLSEEFKAAMEAKKTNNSLSGVDLCDVLDCYCKTDALITAANTTGNVTPQGTASSGSVTPTAINKNSKTAKNLKKVKRALKTLGVNFVHFDEQTEANGSGSSVCPRDHCRLGCICESLGGRTSTSITSSHCGKVDCMFQCNCSKDALKIGTDKTGGRIGIAAQGLRSTATLRRMAQEELKFSNTVVASGMDLLMLGTTAGRQRRERKVPSRYQDTDAFFDPSTGMPATVSQKAAAALMIAGGGEHPEMGHPVHPAIALTPTGSATTMRRMTQEGIKSDRIKKCTVIMPRLEVPEGTKAWCMFHNQHECPCEKYKFPLEFGPDVNASRNVSKRTLGGNFKTVKRRSSEPPAAVSNSGAEKTTPQKKKVVSPLKVPLIKTFSKFGHDVNEHSARTFGHHVRSANIKTRYPHKVVLVKKAPTKDGEEPSFMVKSQKEDNFTNFGKITSVTSLKNAINPMPSNTTIDKSADFSLDRKPKGSAMFVIWTVLKGKILSGDVKIWAYIRSGKPLIFLTTGHDLPYVAEAVGIHDSSLDPHFHGLMHTFR